MKVAKTSIIVLAVSAMLSGAAFAQGVSSDSQTRGGMQRGTGSGMSTGDDTELNSQVETPGGKASTGGKTGAKGTVGSSSGTTRSHTGASGAGAADSRR